jgi:hypothetical protein
LRSTHRGADRDTIITCVEEEHAHLGPLGAEEFLLNVPRSEGEHERVGGIEHERVGERERAGVLE